MRELSMLLVTTFAISLESDGKALDALAASGVPDPWIIAHGLCRRSAFDAAEAFAKRTRGEDGRALPGYVASRRSRASNGKSNELLQEAREAALGGDADRALRCLAGIDLAAASVAVVEALKLRGALLQDRGASEHISLALVSLGTVEFIRGDTASALIRVERAREYTRDPKRMAEIDQLAASIRSVMGDDETALQAYDRAISAARKEGDDRRRGDLLDSKALALAVLKRDEEAIRTS